MATNYPGSLDNFTNPTSASPINSPSHADQHSNANDAIEAIEGELGTNPKGAKATVKARLDDVDTSIATKAPIASPTFTGTVTIPAGSAITGVPYLATANTFTGGVQQITTASAATVGLIVKASASQTANLQEWQNSSGTMLASITDTGFSAAILKVPYIYTYAIQGWNGVGGSIEFANATPITIKPQSASVVNLVIKGAASQTANLQEWQDSAGTVLANVYFDGSLRTNTLRSTTGTAPRIDLNGGTSFGATIGQTGGGTAVQLIVKGAASQTADLTQWQDSAGTVKALVGSIGNAVFNGIRSGSGSTTGAINAYTTAAQIGILVRGAASQSANLQEWQDSTGAVNASLTSTGDFRISNIYAITSFNNAQLNMLSTGARITTTVAANVTLTVKGATSQTADLQEWQDSAGTVLTRINSAGNVYTSGYLTAGVQSPTGTLTVVSKGVSVPVAVIKGATSQTADLQEWQDSAGTVLSKIDAYGNISTLNLYAGGYVGLGAAPVGTARAIISPTISSLVGLIVKAAASQTANLQEWQDSAGTVLTSVDKDGYLQTPRLVITNGGNITDSAGTTPYFGFGSNQIAIYARNASYKPLIIQGAASQTANLQEWQDSAGTALAGIGPNGRIYAQGKTGNTDDLLYLRRADNNIYMYVDKDATLRGNFAIRINQEPTIETQAFMWSGTASRSALGVSGTGSTNPTFYAKATASQTSNLTEWQNSSGTALSYIKSDGSLHFTANSNAVLISGTSTSGLNRIISNGNDLSFSPYFDGLFAPANSAGRWRPANDATSDLGSSGQRWKDLYATSGILTNNSISKVGLIVKAIASQTANLQEWQDSTGAVLASASASGSMSAASFVKTSGTSSQFLKADGSVDSSTYLTTGTASSTYLPLTGGTVSSDLTVTGNFTVNGTTTNLNSTNLVIEDKNIIIADVATPTDTTADGAGITIKGATDKTFNWVQSTGRFTSSEPIQSSAFVSTYVYASQVGSTVIGSATLNTNSDTGGLLINTAGAANKGLTIRGAASQTGDLQQWQNSAGTVITRVRPDGQIGVGSTLITGTNFFVNNTISTTNVVATIRGAASQTANLQEWQNSDAVSVAQISATGTVSIRPVGFSGNLNTAIISVTDRASTWTPGNFAFRSDGNGIPRFSFTAPNAASEALSINGNCVGVQTPSPTSVFQVTSNGAGNTVSIIKGAVSQTANLQEWQNSSGTVLGMFNAYGTLTANNRIYAGWAAFGSGFGTSADAGNVVLIAKGSASQTANLQEWQNSSANVSLAITPDGSIKGGNSSTISANTATTIDTVPLSSFTTIEYTISIKQGSKIRSSKVLVHTDGTSIDSTEYGIMEMGGGITGILVTASVSSTNSILQVTITDASTTNATVKIIKTML